MRRWIAVGAALWALGCGGDGFEGAAVDGGTVSPDSHLAAADRPVPAEASVPIDSPVSLDAATSPTQDAPAEATQGQDSEAPIDGSTRRSDGCGSPPSCPCGVSVEWCGAQVVCPACGTIDAGGTPESGSTPDVCIPITTCPSPCPRQDVCTATACGTRSDGCGGTIQCGGCGGSQVCINNSFCCTPLTQAQACAGKQCGTAADCAGNVYDCGSCSAGDVCLSNSCVQRCTRNLDLDKYCSTIAMTGPAAYTCNSPAPPHGGCTPAQGATAYSYCCTS